jgi:hypothetical protein
MVRNRTDDFDEMTSVHERVGECLDSESPGGHLGGIVLGEDEYPQSSHRGPRLQGVKPPEPPVEVVVVVVVEPVVVVVDAEVDDDEGVLG